jgi:hypothetical protein
MNCATTEAPMDSLAAIELVAGWLDGVDVSSVPTRVAKEHRALRRHNQTSVDPDITVLTSSERWIFCVHEAAHAVTHHFFGAEVLRAMVYSSGGGFVEHLQGTEDALGAAVGMLSGIMAELSLGVDSTRQFVLSHSTDVLETAHMIAQMPADLGADNMAVATLAGATVQSRWTEINRVAESLRGSRTLVGPEIAALCGPAH